MYGQELYCPHPGCDERNPPGSQFCARCGRPLTLNTGGRFGETNIAWGWFFAALASTFFLMPCLLSSFRRPGGFVVLIVPAFLWVMAFRGRGRYPR